MNKITTINIKDLDIKKFQSNLKDKEMSELDFVDNISFIITKDEIYVKSNEIWSPDIRTLRIWFNSMMDNYTIQNYYLVECNEDEQDEEIEKLIDDMITKCKRTDQEYPI